MAKIKIEDLPVTEELSAEEQKGIVGGAGQMVVAGVESRVASQQGSGMTAPTQVASAQGMTVASAQGFNVASAQSFNVASAQSFNVASNSFQVASAFSSKIV